ncbi:MAG TPA: hypothetical protein VLL25_00645, partial [Acidimicrobiales bacterium]|nr:hypothetical protein [Acidimicrobiales bacterium]
LELAASGSVASAVDALVGHGVDREVAAAFGRLDRLARVADVAAASREAGRPVGEVAAAFDALDEGLGLSGFEARLGGLHPGGRWERWQARSLLDDVARLRREAVVRGFDPSSPSVGGGRLARFERLARQVDGTSGQALAVAALAVRALAELVESA